MRRGRLSSIPRASKLSRPKVVRSKPLSSGGLQKYYDILKTSLAQSPQDLRSFALIGETYLKHKHRPSINTLSPVQLFASEAIFAETTISLSTVFLLFIEIIVIVCASKTASGEGAVDSFVHSDVVWVWARMNT